MDFGGIGPQIWGIERAEVLKYEGISGRVGGMRHGNCGDAKLVRKQSLWNNDGIGKKQNNTKLQ